MPRNIIRFGRWQPLFPALVLCAIAALAVAGDLLSGSRHAMAAQAESADKPAPAAFVGSAACKQCHAGEFAAWHKSNHHLAMQEATEATVRGDFDNSSFDKFGVHSRFFRKDGKFFVETDGPDGKLATFEVKYTFGVEPLQQYLIKFPDGRLQVLSIAWDTRPRDEGGQRWFHLYPNEKIAHDDILHWTKLNQNWNFMCAECHSTGVHKNYDAAKDTFATTWAEIDVGCETCHGAGSRHVAWADSQKKWWPLGKAKDATKGLAVLFDERKDVTWSWDEGAGKPRRSTPPRTLRKEVETCGLCHARRSAFSEKWVPGQWLSDTHHVSLLERQLFHADGQMRNREETYDYAPFKQSKMFAKGVTCADCHDPHSASLRAPGDGVCLQCHASHHYETTAHRHHEGMSKAIECTSCHMRERTYMVVDQRHDHSFRVPRPDLSVKLGTPNACNDCHKDKSAQWAATAIEQWFGPKREGFQHYAEAFHAAWTDQPDAARLLAKVAANDSTPGFVRASALSELNGRVSETNIDLARKSLSDPDPMVRIGALDVLEGIPADRLWSLAAPLLSDPIRGVRIRAASLLAAVPRDHQPAGDRDRFARAAAEFVAAQRFNADRPEARTTLGAFYARRGLAGEAETEYKAALHLSPQFAPAAINLADLYRQQGRDDEGARVLETAIVASPDDAGLHYALGLALVRLHRSDEALAQLRRAAELAPDQARYAYVYAVGLHSVGQSQKAMATLKANLARHPSDRATLMALISFNRDAGDLGSALDYAQRLDKLAPGDSRLQALIDALKRQLKATGQ